MSDWRHLFTFTQNFRRSPKECFIISSGEALNVTLLDNDTFRLYTVVPLEDDVTYLGRTDKYIGIAAIESSVFDTVTLIEGGEFSFVCAPEYEVRVFTDSRELEVTRNGSLCTVVSQKKEKQLIVMAGDGEEDE